MLQTMTDRDGESRRQIARRQQRKAGDRSARLAHTLMEVPASTIAKLELDDDLREDVERARAVTSPIARRRAERTLAGDLRGVDLVALADRISNVQDTGGTDVQAFHLAERWRTTLIEGGIGAAVDFPGDRGEPLAQLIDNAQRERDTGKPPGAARALASGAIRAWFGAPMVARCR
jgi:ribosomal 50S subunit-associated protein YjgA (DUF615 family)